MSGRARDVFAAPVAALIAAWLARVGLAFAVAGASGTTLLSNSLTAVAGARFVAPNVDEGPLRNESRALVDDRTATAFEQADAALAAAREGRGEIEAVFESWLRAATNADRSRAVPVAAMPGHEAAPLRLFEGPEVALERRIAWLDAAERRLWRDHTETLARVRLEAAGFDATRLAAVQRELPGTRAAARAGLGLCDLAAARGDVVAALGWLRRAAECLELAGPSDDVEIVAAIDRRERALRALRPVTIDPSSALLAAGGLEPAGSVTLDDLLGPAPRVVGLAPGTGLFPGLVTLDDGRWCVQTASRLHIVVPGEARVTERFEPSLLVGSTLGAPPLPNPTSSAPGWWLQPATDGRDLLLVEGGGRSGSSTSNTLMRLTPPPSARPAGGAPEDASLARLVWARSAGGWLSGTGAVAPLAELAGAEFQPGPLVLGDVAAVQVRRGSGDIEAFLSLVDWRTGAVVFERPLVIGREVGPDLGRFSNAPARGAGSPLGRDGTRVLVVTNLGVVALVDTLDGRLLWSLLTQRRDGSVQGDTFTGVHQVWCDDAVFVAPADSDLLYRLPRGPFPGAAPEPSTLGDPQERGEHLFLAGVCVDRGGSSGVRLITAVRSGARHALALFDPHTATSVPGVFLPVGEALCEGVYVSPDGRIVAAAGEHHLYLFDGTRELYLLDERALIDPWAPRQRGRSPALGGTVHVAGGYVGVVSSDALVLMRPRRANAR